MNILIGWWLIIVIVSSLCHKKKKIKSQVDFTIWLPIRILFNSIVERTHFVAYDSRVSDILFIC